MASYENFALNGTWTGSSAHASYPVTNLGDEAYVITYNVNTTWLSAAGVVANITLDCDFGAVKTFRYVEVIKISGVGTTLSIQDYEIYVSSNGVDWGAAVANGTLSQPATAYVESEIIDIGSDQTYQYIRFKVLNNYGHATYVGANEILVYPDNVNLSADETTNIVADSMAGATRADDNLENSVFGTTANTEAWLTAILHERWFSIDFDFGSQKYIDYIALFLWKGGSIEPKNYQLSTSADNVTWEQPFATGTLAENANVWGEVRNIDFSSTPRYTRYLRLQFRDSWHSGTYGAALHMARCYETSTPAVPSAPDKPVATGCGTQDVYITWTYSEPADFDYYEVHRSADGGAYSKISTDEQVKEKYYLDVAPAGTNFTYQIKAVTKVPTTSAASTASDSTTKGAAGGETSHTFS